MTVEPALDEPRGIASARTSTEPTTPIVHAAHRWMASALTGGAVGAALGLACVIFAPTEPAETVDLTPGLGRLGIVVLSGLLGLGCGTLSGLLSVPFARAPRAARITFATVLWLWVVPFVAEIAYRHALGKQPTSSALAPILRDPGPFVRALPVAVLAGIFLLVVFQWALLALIAGLVPRVSRQVSTIRPWLTVGLLFTMFVVTTVSTTRISTRWAWVQRGVPLVALVFGVNIPTLSNYSTSGITPGPLLAPTAPAVASPPKPVPNILFIVLESVNASYLGYGGRDPTRVTEHRQVSRNLTANASRLGACARDVPRGRRHDHVDAPAPRLDVRHVREHRLPAG